MTRRRLAALGGLLLLALAGPVWAKSYDHPLIEQTFRLLPNGDADVREIRTFRFDGSFSWAEITRNLRGQYGRYELVYAGVWDADTGAPLRFEVSQSGNDKTVRWYYQAQDTTRRFVIRYRIQDAVQRYRDAAQFYWQAVEGDHAPIRQVRITVIPPRPSPGLFKVFIHSKAAPGELAIAENFSRAVITQSDIPETSFVEIRALLDPALFPSAPVLGAQTYESLLADERAQAESELRVSRIFTLALAAAGLLIAGLIAAYVVTYLRYGKEPAVAYDAPYEREPPQPLPPAVVPAIMTQGRVRNTEMPKAFAATLLEAARLGYLQVEETQDRGVLGTGLFKDTDLVYRLTNKGYELLESHRVPDRPAKERALEPFEIEVLDAVFRRAGGGGVATSDQIEQWGKRMSGSKSNFLRFIERWAPQLRSWFERRFFKLDDPASERAKGTFIAVTVVVMILTFFVGLGVSLIVAGPVGLVLIGLSMKGLSRRTPQAAVEIKRWEAFRRFMTDFSAMKDAGPQLLPLWEQYLVYATALGVAERLLANLKLVAAELSTTLPRPTWYYGPSRSDMASAGLSFASLETLTRSLQNFQNLSRALSTSSRTGGGFSGGGGGGGGGGGSSRAG